MTCQGLKQRSPKPRWWLPYWLIQIVLAIVFWGAGYVFLNFSLLITSIGLAVTFVFIGVLCWIRTKQPNWLKPYWIALTVSALAIGALSYFYLNAPLERVIASTVLILLSISLGYYIRVKPNVKINRAMYIGLGAVVLGFVLWLALALILDVAGVPRTISRNGLMFGLPSLIVCYIVGGYIGDLIGKKRDYRLPLYP
jgi:drug/metabolite transporter (DMT)-like permease